MHINQPIGALPCTAFVPQAELAKACPAIISTRFLGDVFNDELGKPGTFFSVNWAKQ